MNWEQIWITVKNYAATGGVNILKAILILIIGVLLVKLVMKVVQAILSKTKLEKITQTFLCSVLRFILNLIVIISAIQSLGVNTTGLIAMLSAAGLAVGLALQNSLSNLANGIVIISTHPFKEGDYVSINGVEGTVQNIRMLTTAIASVDNKLIIIPNSTIVTNEVINYNARKTRRVSFNFDVAYESDLELAKKIILDVMLSDGRVRASDPKPPFVALKELKDSSIGLFAYCWCSGSDYWDVYYYIMDNVYNEFKRNNISVPFQQMEVRLRNDVVNAAFRKSALQQRVEIKTEEEKHNMLADFLFTKKKKKIKNVESPKELIEDKSQQEIVEAKLKNNTPVVKSNSTPTIATPNKKELDKDNVKVSDSTEHNKDIDDAYDGK